MPSRRRSPPPPPRPPVGVPRSCVLLAALAALVGGAAHRRQRSAVDRADPRPARTPPRGHVAVTAPRARRPRYHPLRFGSRTAPSPASARSVPTASSCRHPDPHAWTGRHADPGQTYRIHASSGRGRQGSTSTESSRARRPRCCTRPSAPTAASSASASRSSSGSTSRSRARRPPRRPAAARGQHHPGRRGRLALVQLVRGPLPRARPTGSRAPRSPSTPTLAGLRVPGTDAWGSDKPVTGGFTHRPVVPRRRRHQRAHHDRQAGRQGRARHEGLDRPAREYPTKGGVHIVLVREREHLYNSATIGIPTASPDGYYHKLPYSVRISNGGAFVHAEPLDGPLPGQPQRQPRLREHVGRRCPVVLREQQARRRRRRHPRGRPAEPQDAGMSDWNYTWEQWQAGNLDG